MRQKIKTLMILISCLTALNLNANTANESADSYKTIENPNEFIESEFAKAKEDNKKLLFILGGNWCHDSRSLAEKLNNQSLAPTIKKHYRISMIDVGFLNQGFEFTEKAQMKTFYATPTVLIFDPSSKKQINASDMHIWSRAAKVDQKVANDYFQQYAGENQATQQQPLTLKQEHYLTKLEDFISLQESRIKSAYLVVGPLLERNENNKKDEHFEVYWKALAKLRFALPDDSMQIRDQILSSNDQELAEIKFPIYQRFPWDS